MAKAKGDAMKLEEALKTLEKIVADLETKEDLPLDEAIALYEQGMKLSALCQQKLAAAQQKIVEVQENANGGLTEKPLAPPPQEASLFDQPGDAGEDVPF